MLSGAAVRRAAHLTRLTTAAWIGLVAVDLALFAGFHRVHERVRRCRVKPVSPHAPVDDVVWAVEEACVWYVKRAACLQRSIVATWLLRRNGVAAELVIGYRPIPFESHAWVEVEGTVVNDLPQYPKAFMVLARL